MNKFINIIQIVFITLWTIVIFGDYWIKHIMYDKIVNYFVYTHLIVTLVILSGIFSFVILKFRDHPILSKAYNGIGIILLFFFLNSIALEIYDAKVNLATVKIDAAHHFRIMGLLLKSGFFILSLLAIASGIGHSMNKLIGFRVKKRVQRIVEIALGIQGLVFVLFILGVFSLLRVEAVAPVLLILAGLHYKTVLGFFKSVLIDPIKVPKKLNVIGAISFFFMIYFVGLNFFQINTAFPLGFDALNLYGNLPKLLADHQQIVGGYDLYNWSLFMSLGYIVFSSSEVAMGLSMMGGALMLFSLFNLGRYYMKADLNVLLFAMLVFYLTPTICVQSYLEIKIDLGLLFILSTALVVLAEWVRRTYQKDEFPNEVVEQVEAPTKKGKKILVANKNKGLTKVVAKIPKMKASKKYAEPIVLGLLLGFAFGIKLTTLFALFATVLVFWFIYTGRFAALGVSLMMIATMLVFGLDNMSGMRGYHLSVNTVKWALFLIGVGILGYNIRDQKERAVKAFLVSAITAGLFLAVNVPWVTRNFAESKCLSQNCLLRGEAKERPIPWKYIHEKYKGHQRGTK